MEPQSVKKSPLVTIISIVIILTTLLTAFAIMGALNRGTGILLGQGNMILGGIVMLGKIIFAIGLIKMRKWALIGITITFAVDIALSFITAGSLVSKVGVAIKVIALIYLWLINRKFS